MNKRGPGPPANRGALALSIAVVALLCWAGWAVWALRGSCPSCDCSAAKTAVHIRLAAPNSGLGKQQQGGQQQQQQQQQQRKASPAAGKKHDVVVPEFPPGDNYTTLPDLAAKVLEAERQGRGRRIVAMSLYGDKPRYTMGAIDNAVLVRRDWGGNWTLRIYYGEGVPQEVLDTLTMLGAEMVHISSNQKGIAGMFWRFFALEDRTATRVIIRDVDSRLTNRDRRAVEEWEQSGHFFHIMQDNPYHSVPVMGGMWGAVNGFIHPSVLRRWREQDKKDDPTYSKGSDQDWLAANLWPSAREHALQHASYHCGDYGAKEWRGFPTQRLTEHDYIGNVYAPDNNYEASPLKGDCPAQCRRQPEWAAC